MILKTWKLMDARCALWYCVSLFLSSWVAFGLGMALARFDIGLTIFFFILGGFLLIGSEVLYWKYRSGLRKRIVQA
jgi:hypothetical protein